MARNNTALEVSRPPKRNWRIGANETLYALSIIDTRIGDVGSFSAGGAIRLEGGVTEVLSSLRDKDMNEPSEFLFRMNPRNMQMEEPAAVVIIPTQGGSQFVEHQGQIYKNITITGTTGLRPNRKFQPSLAGVSSPLFGGDNDGDTGLPVGERTGFEDLISLRNLFRRYWSMKTDGSKAPFTLMIWQNIKEGEFYVVEPMNFSTVRDAKSPYTFEYNISLRTIERLDIRRTFTKDSLAETNGRPQLLGKMRRASQVLRQGFMLIDAAIDTTVGIGKKTVTDLLTPVNDLVLAVTGITNNVTGTLAFPLSSVTALVQSSLDMRAAILNFESGTKAYQELGIMTDRALSANQSKKIAWVAAMIAADDSLFSEKTSTHTGRRRERYRDPLTGNPRTGGDPTNLDNAPIPAGTRQATVQSGETIRSLAKRLLGNTNLWKQLVIVNDLRAPYISPDGDGVEVLRPTDPILFPSSGSAAPPTTVASDRTAQTVQKDAMTSRLGRDILLSSNQALGALTNFDFEVNEKGDIALIEGVDNMKQAVEIKFSTEPGSLPVHPFFGILAPIGEKIQTRSVIQFQTNALASLLSDTRIEDVVSFSARADGNVLSVKTSLRIRGADSAIGLAFGVRR